ncbi:MAG: TlpA disulfide reductase family protein [Bacteroidales bacterium]|nr:TlpA disulfide reductase family protein [Bacteroidales bacterium]
MIKKMLLSAICFLMVVRINLSAQTVSVIEGKWIFPAATTMRLCHIKNGNLVETASAQINSQGCFAFAFYPPAEGYYALLAKSPSYTYQYIFYFRPGDFLQFTIENDTWYLTGKNTPENLEMEKWHNLIQPLEGKAVYFMHKQSTYRDFFPELEKTLCQMQSMGSAQTPNPMFNASFEDFKTFNMADIATAFLLTPSPLQPVSKDFINYYRNLDIAMFTQSVRILDYPNAMDLLTRVYYGFLRSDTSLNNEEFLARLHKQTDYFLNPEKGISSDCVKGEYILHKAVVEKKDYQSMMVFKDIYYSYLVTQDQRERFQTIVAKLDDHSPGHEALDFRFPDITGKEVSLSGLKGKVVYIDVWATWCGPCKLEIPYMTRLEEEFSNNPDIAFISVSVDASKDKQIWQEMVQKKGMKGIQLFAGDAGHKQICNDYKITSIPRFILVGKDGRLISVDAPRPSSSEIHLMLKKALQH